MTKLHEREVFELLEPPPGGLERLRGKIQRGERRRAMWLLPMAGTLAAVAVLLVWLTGPSTIVIAPVATLESTQQPIALDIESHPRFAASSEPVVVPDGARTRVAVRRIAVDDPDVVFYMMAHADIESTPSVE